MKDVFFRSLIHTNWILFSILLDHNFALFRFEYAIVRTIQWFSNFSCTSLDLSWSILCLKHVFFRSLIHTNWILFSILLDHVFALFRSEYAIVRTIQWFSNFSCTFLDLSWSIPGLKHVFFRSLIHTYWILFSILLDHNFALFRFEYAIVRTIQWFSNFSCTSLDLLWSILCLKHVFFRSLIHTNWILFSILLDHVFA